MGAHLNDNKPKCSKHRCTKKRTTKSTKKIMILRNFWIISKIEHNKRHENNKILGIES